MQKKDEPTPRRNRNPKPTGDDLDTPRNDRQRDPNRNRESEELDEEIE